MHDLLVRFVLLLWSLIAPGLERTGDAKAIASALVDAVLEDAGGAPVYTSHLEDLSSGAFWAYRESSLQADAMGDCRTLPTGFRYCAARGPWQLHGDCGWAPLPEQARCWLRILHDGQAMCPGLPGAALWGACSGDVVTPTTGGGAVTLRIEKLARKREAKIRDLYRSALDAFRETP